MNVRSLYLWNYMPGGTYGVPYSLSFLLLGGTLPYNVTLVGGKLPSGLTLNSATLTVTGTPADSGSFTENLQFTDSSGDPTHTLIATQYPYIGSSSATVNINNYWDLGTLSAGATYSFSPLQACCLPSYAWSLVGGTLPPGLTLSSSGQLTGTIPVGTAGTYRFLVRVEDPINSANFAVREFQYYVSPLQVTTSNFPSFGNVGTPYSGSITATGGTGTITWSLDNSYNQNSYLPPGLTVHANGTVDGTPTVSGQYWFRLRATDGAGAYLLWWINISIYPPGVVPPLNVQIGPFTNLTFGQFTSQLQATGGVPPYHYSLTPAAPSVPGMRVQDGPPLPTFFSSTATGGFIGVLASPGTFPTSVRVTDSTGQFFDRATSLQVSSLSILNTSPPKATIGVPYSFQLMGYGGTNYSWSAANMPPGLSLDGSGLISGTPTSSGNFFPSVTLTDLLTLDTYRSNPFIQVDPFPIVTDGILPPATVGVSYTQPLSAPGCLGTCTWTTLSVGGLSLGSDGVLSGTPTFSGPQIFTATVAGSNGTVQKVFSLYIASSTPQSLSMSTSSFGDNTIGTSMSLLLTAQGGTPPYNWTLESGSLPPGVSLQGPGETVCYFCGPGRTYLFGRAMQAGVYAFTLKVTDSFGASVTRAFTWNISRLQVSYNSLPLSGAPLTYNTAYNQALLALGGTGTYTWSAGPMPPGLTLSSSGIVSGTPTNTGSFSTPYTVQDGSSNSFSGTLFFNIGGGTLGFNLGANLGTFLQGNSTSFSVIPSGGTAPYTITALSALPPGFTLVPLTGSGIAQGSMTLTGLFAAPGTYSFTLRVQDSLGAIGVRTFTAVVAPFNVFTTGLPDASVGAPYSQLVAANIGTAPTWTVPGTTVLPPGITVSPTGVISGTPTAAGTFTFQATATAGGVSVTFTFSLRVSNVALSDAPILPAATVNVPYTYPFQANGGGTKVFTITGLPAGLTMSTSGVITGTVPTQTSGTAASLLLTINDGGVILQRRFVLPVLNSNPNVLDISLASTALPDATLGQFSSFGLAANGGVPPYVWSVAMGSALPPGLSLLSGAGLGNNFPGTTVLTGAPTTAGSYSFDLVATDRGRPHRATGLHLERVDDQRVCEPLDRHDGCRVFGPHYRRRRHWRRTRSP